MKGQYADKERAVAMLSSMTMYIDHHEVLLEAGVLPSLMSAVSNPKVEPTVSSLGLCTMQACCTADAEHEYYSVGSCLLPAMGTNWVMGRSKSMQASL